MKLSDLHKNDKALIVTKQKDGFSTQNMSDEADKEGLEIKLL